MKLTKKNLVDGFYMFSGDIETIGPFMHKVKKWPNVPYKSYGIHTAKCLMYVWPFLNIHEIVNLVFLLLIPCAGMSARTISEVLDHRTQFSCQSSVLELSIQRTNLGFYCCIWTDVSQLGLRHLTNFSVTFTPWKTSLSYTNFNRFFK